MARSEGARLEHREDMRRYNWRYTWATRYNQAASLLLVSGVMDEVDGALAVFEVTEAGEYRLRQMVDNNPYDVMGCWVTTDTWLAGHMTWTSEDGQFLLMEAKLSLCHLPESFDEYDGALDATEHMDTVLRYVTRPVLGQYLVE